MTPATPARPDNDPHRSNRDDPYANTPTVTRHLDCATGMDCGAVTRIVWIIGQGGLLGAALQQAVSRRNGWEVFDAPRLPWGRPQQATRTARATARRLLECAMRESEHSTEWSIVWVAGSGVVGTSAETLDAEYRQFSSILRVIGEEVTAADAASHGTLFYASSAGGVYAGSQNPPHTEDTEPRPLAPYGKNKLRMETAANAFSQRTRVSTFVGRIANLYGPGQKLDKMQGLISHLAQAQFSPRPVSIFVPLDTLRDYIYVDDCAALILDCVHKLASLTTTDGVTRVTKILGSGQAVTISSLIGYFRALAKGHPHIMLGSSPLTSLQAIDLRLESVRWPDMDRRPLTPLAAGIHATMLDILRRIQAS